jgi:hypothetical protein
VSDDDLSAVLGWVFVAVGIVIVIAFLIGCAPQRVTVETRWPGDPPLAIVEWPRGTTAADVHVFDVDGRALAVGAYESQY